MAIDGAGRILYAGGSSIVLRIRTNGTLDPSFQSALAPRGAVGTLLPDSDGRILVSLLYGGGRVLYRLLENGSIDEGFHADLSPDDIRTDPSVGFSFEEPDGRIILFGNFQRVNGVARHGIARLNRDGTLDPGFANETSTFDPALLRNRIAAARGPDGRWIVASESGLFVFTADGKWNVMQSEVGLLAGFKRTLTPEISALFTAPDGEVILAGRFSYVSNTPVSGIARLMIPAGGGPPRIARGQFSGQRFLIEVPTRAGSEYRLEWKESLSSGAWFPGSSALGNGQVRIFSDDPTPQQQRFYRVREFPPAPE